MNIIFFNTKDCVYERELGGSGGNSSLSNDGDQSGDLGAPLNWISWSLIIVSSGLMTLLFALLAPAVAAAVPCRHLRVANFQVRIFDRLSKSK